jgi:hypothetical protein
MAGPAVRMVPSTEEGRAGRWRPAVDGPTPAGQTVIQRFSKIPRYTAALGYKGHTAVHANLAHSGSLLLDSLDGLPSGEA